MKKLLLITIVTLILGAQVWANDAEFVGPLAAKDPSIASPKYAETETANELPAPTIEIIADSLIDNDLQYARITPVY